MRCLSDRLKELEGARVVERDVEASTPVRITYRLTKRGEELATVLGELQVWAERWAKEPVGRGQGGAGGAKRRPPVNRYAAT